MALVNVIHDIGGSFGYLLRPGSRSRLGIARRVGSARGSTGAALTWLLVEGGHGELQVNGESTVVDGRVDVFDGSGWSALIPPKTRFAVRGALRYTLTWRGWTRDAEVRLMKPDEVTDEQPVSAVERARVRTYLPAGPLVCGETIVEPGGWSPWPPHEHEHEEVHLFRFDPSDGFGVQFADSRLGVRRGDVVGDGDVRRIKAGPHPVVAAPDSTMCCLWVLAGEPDRDPVTANASLR